ncbi:heme acquisition protein HasA [Yersinia enterocolitica]|uniref:heme acquisition protein HasA n=1 Tax=Yersinia enterocolitica TaxID=630 RepID=UPI0021E787D5|nr:heme acquisition protein HasA [Yersinia enterocolitica]MCV3314183.1 heme acquisition protein HasA [Yersinia enterocolitica]UYJ89203.1 heme acquisition protein HasA [Yersinia enterocolitica]UYJ93196.1 heme acquisition protein HasA [Yersinia enterocolitica]UYK22706.1 heme acquisition protein HasA [Yersinia enterocolitica]UYK26685.1 heme acquisition protein HasA [Yersinia enterocolitica]
MTITIKYHEQIKNETIYSYTYWWAYDFGDIALESSENEYHLYSAGPNPPTVGVKYAIQSSTSQSKVAIVMESKGMHAAMVFETNGVKISTEPTLIPGESEGLQFDNYLIPIPNADLDDYQCNQLQLQQVQLEFRGLAISDDIDISIFEVIFSMLINDVYPSNNVLGVYGLLRGNNAPILEILKSQGVDVNTPFKDLAIASQFEITTDTPIIEIVGTTDGGDILLAA